MQAVSQDLEDARSECCADCGDELDPFGAEGFTVCGGTTLCFACSIERGGSWDEARHVWSVVPDYADLAEGYD